MLSDRKPLSDHFVLSAPGDGSELLSRSNAVDLEKQSLINKIQSGYKNSLLFCGLYTHAGPKEVLGESETHVGASFSQGLSPTVGSARAFKSFAASRDGSDDVVARSISSSIRPNCWIGRRSPRAVRTSPQSFEIDVKIA